jgi:hypothetical protein
MTALLITAVDGVNSIYGSHSNFSYIMNQLPEGLVPQLPAGYQHTNLPMIQNVSCVIP